MGKCRALERAFGDLFGQTVGSTTANADAPHSIILCCGRKLSNFLLDLTMQALPTVECSSTKIFVG